MCDVVIEDSLKLCDICLYKNDSSDYFLVFPSKQDVYRDVQLFNKEEVKFPPLSSACTSRKKQFEEFYYPMSSDFYKELLQLVVDGYLLSKKTKKNSYIP
jgi:hypothetical protein